MKWNRVIIDADSLLYRCGFAAEGEPIENACHSLKLQINAIKEKVGATESTIYVKGRGNFRDDLAISKVYKGTRTTRKPSNYEEMRRYIIDVHKAIAVDGMEADDAASVDIWKNKDVDSGVILAAMDKDLWNTPGWHYNYHPNKQTIQYITLKEANMSFITQLLTGDKSDNIAGLPYCTDAIIAKYGLSQQAKKGCGEVSAAKILRDSRDQMDALNRVWEAYAEWAKDYYPHSPIPEAVAQVYFLEQGQLLWMTRELNDDGTPIVWRVPNDCNYWKALL